MNIYDEQIKEIYRKYTAGELSEDELTEEEINAVEELIEIEISELQIETKILNAETEQSRRHIREMLDELPRDDEYRIVAERRYNELFTKNDELGKSEKARTDKNAPECSYQGK